MVSRLLSLALLPALASAFSFNIGNTPTQCGPLSINITGAGKPPYTALIIPFGASPLPNNIEVRKITQQNFTGDATSVSFQLNFPENSQFVAVVGDQDGYASGGSSGAVTVQSSDDASCFNSTAGVQPGFFYSLVPNSLQQCVSTRIWWDPSAGVQGTPIFRGVIPGGQSFVVPEGSFTTVPEQGFGFSWTPSVRAGSTVIIVAGDNRGPGSGGSATYFINYSTDNSCLNDASPSSTSGPPAGGSYPTSPSQNDNSSSHSSSNTGAIVGGVVGGVGGAAVILVLLWFFWRWRRQQKLKARPVDLLQDQEGEGEHDPTLPQYYRPEPFIVPDPTVSSSSGLAGPETAMASGLRPSIDHRLSQYSTTTGEGGLIPGSRSGTPDASSSNWTRKSPAPPSFRPVNIVQHEDAGPSEADVSQTAETIELPPAYTNIKRPVASQEPPPPPEATD